MKDESQVVIQRLYHAIERGDEDALKEVLTGGVTFREHPNRVSPRGSVADRSQVLASFRAGSQLLSKQSYRVHSLLQQGDQVAVRLTWTGEIAKAAGPYQAGQVLTAHLAQFFVLRDGRIAAIETYDCYEPDACR